MKETSISNKALIQFVKSARLHIKNLDNILGKKNVPNRGIKIANETNRFENDLTIFASMLEIKKVK